MHTVYLNLNQVFNFSDNTCLIRLIFIFTLYATIFLIVICEIFLFFKICIIPHGITKNFVS